MSGRRTSARTYNVYVTSSTAPVQVTSAAVARSLVKRHEQYGYPATYTRADAPMSRAEWCAWVERTAN